MKNHLLTSLILLFALSSTSFAEEAKSDTVIATVHGMVCEFCAVGLEQQFKKRDEVKVIEVSLEAGTVKLQFHAGQRLDDELITKIITDNGINVESIVAADAEAETEADAG